MANTEKISGSNSFVLYGKETTYNTAVTTNLHFGLDQNFKPNVNNNIVSNYGFSGSTPVEARQVQSFTAGQLELSGSMDMKIQHFKHLEFVFGSASGSSSPITYSMAAIPPSFTLSSNIDNDTTDQVVTYSGGVIDSYNIRSSVGQPITATMDMKFGLVVISTTLNSRIALSSEPAYNFAYGSIVLPGPATLPNIIDSFELSITNQYEMLYGVGSRLARNALPKGIQISLKVSLKYLDNALFTAALGATTPTATGSPTEYATIVLNFGNPTGDTCVMTLSKVPLAQFSQIHELNNPIGEDLSFTAGSISAVETFS